MISKPPRRTGAAWRAGVALFAVLLGFLGGCADSRVDAAPPGGIVGGGTLAVVPELVERLGPSVVTVLRSDGGLGSGVVYRADGLIVTNEHVIRGAQEVTVSFADGSRVQGRVRAADVVTDLAVVQVPRSDLPAPQFAEQLPRQGELAVVIGTPLGFANTVTTGVVSGLGREIPGSTTRGSQALVDLIQTDAPISPGNSGGALLDAQGRVIGISEAYLPPQSGAVAIGFAIPSTTVVAVVEQLLADGSAQHPYLGVTLEPLTDALREALRVPAQQGAVVLDVRPGGPAAAGGVRPGDVIVRFDDEPVTTVENILGALRNVTPGQSVPLTVQRGNEQVELSITVGERS
ncbi:MAG: S1C family serine protease [Pseudonocardiaceae bacterium]